MRLVYLCEHDGCETDVSEHIEYCDEHAAAAFAGDQDDGVPPPVDCPRCGKPMVLETPERGLHCMSCPTESGVSVQCSPPGSLLCPVHGAAPCLGTVLATSSPTSEVEDPDD